MQTPFVFDFLQIDWSTPFFSLFGKFLYFDRPNQATQSFNENPIFIYPLLFSLWPCEFAADDP